MSQTRADTYRVCGVRIDVCDLQQAVDQVIDLASTGSGAALHLCNAYVLALASRDAEYAALLNGGDLNLPDGAPVVWLGRMLGLPGLRGRVSGPELMEGVLAKGAEGGLRHYLYGSTPEVVTALRASIAQRVPDATVVGAESPPFRELSDDEVTDFLRRVDTAGADVIWVGLGTPKQDHFVARIRGRTSAVTVPVGAAFEFLAGARRRAPRWMQTGGLEWVHRLLQEPRRLGARYTTGNVRFLLGIGAGGALSPARWRVRLRRVLVLADVLAIGLSSLLAYLSRGALSDFGLIGPLANEVPVALGVLPLWLMVLATFGCYRPQYVNASGEAFRRFLGGTTAGVILLGFTSFVFNLQLSRLYVVLLFVYALLLGGGARFAIQRYLRHQRAHGRFKQRALIVGCDSEGLGLASAMELDPGAGYSVVGFIDDDRPIGTAVWRDRAVVGRTHDVLAHAVEHGVGLVVVSPASLAPGALSDLTVALEGSLVDLAVAPSLFQVVTRRVTMESVANVPILHVDQIRLTWGKATVKRLLDVLVAIIILTLLWPIMAIAALAVKLEDGGPILFRQTRVGRFGQHFTLLKFRTMHPDAEEHLDGLRPLNEAGQHFFKIREDPRVTRVGRVLRKWSIDETPQLLQALVGRLSLVGPRPALPHEVEKYEDWHLRRLRVKPGVTGVWQVSGRSNVPFDEAVRMDLFYIENWSVGFDLTILMRTVTAVLGRQGAW